MKNKKNLSKAEAVALSVIGIVGLGTPAKTIAKNSEKIEIQQSKSETKSQKSTASFKITAQQYADQRYTTYNGKASKGENSRFKQKMKCKKYCKPKSKK